MKAMKIMRMFIAFTAIFVGMTGWAGDSAPFLLDTIIDDALVETGGEVSFNYNSPWIGGDSSGEVVIAADGTVIKRMTGEGEFTWSPTTSGKHTLTYTTYINGVAQDEVYTATVYADWKYMVEDGKATIVETTHTSGNVVIPSEIDGYPVVGNERGVFAGCTNLFLTVPLCFTNVVSAVKSFEQNEWVRDNSGPGAVYRSNDISHNSSTYMTATVKGPCEFSFDWKVSSEGYYYDKLRWYLNGSWKAEISGEQDWQTVTYSLSDGDHVIKWVYSKNVIGDGGFDCGWVRMKMKGFQFGDATYLYSDFPCSWGGDTNWKTDNDGSLRSGKITHGQSTWMEMKAPGPGLLTYRWKASCEYWVDEIFDYGYLSVDGVAKGCLIDDDYSLEGIAIGGQTDWQDVEVGIEGEGEHILRWTFTKDAIDEGDVGEDCIWVSNLKFRPLTTLSFNIGAANGSVPLSVTELSEAVIKLPLHEGFDRPFHIFTGWSDGVNVYAPGGDFEMRATNVTLTAVYRANTIAMPVVNSRDVVAGGVHNKASATIKISADSGTTIYYTLDGSVPTSKSRRYDEPFAVDTLGTVTVKAIALRDNYFDSPVATFSFTRSPYSAAECLNISGWKVNLTGNAEWFRVLGEAAHDGDAALRSGAIGDNQSSAVEVKVAGEGSLSFWWKSSSETSRGRKRDYVSFQIDGAEYAWLGGSNDWTNVVCNITGTGEHTLKWEYIKNEEALQGEDCAWLDEVVLTSFQVPKSSITYENLRGATHTNPEKYQDGSVVEFTNPSAVEGYTFAGWMPERITADMSGAQIVRANWTANNYTIAYNSNGGFGTMEPTLATYDSEAIVKNNEFIRDGYTFKGWALEEGCDVAYAPGQSVMNLTAQLNGVVTFYAVWERILIAVDEPVAAENLIYNGTEQVGVGAAEGYTLSGVTAATDAGEYIAIATLADGYKWADGSLEDKTITWSIAKAANEWITEPKISLESWIEGETVGELTDGVAKFGAVVVTMGGEEFTTLPTAPGSYTIEYSVAETGNFSGLIKSVTFEIIKYVPIISEITYENLRGATHTNPETYQEGTVVEFIDPSEVEGYTFAGWTPERITADMTGAQTVRANWTANNYTIAYNSNGGSGTMEPTLATYDSEAIVKNNEFIRDGYTFKGWALEEGCDVAYAPGQSVINLTAQLNGVITFYAVWERILIAVDEPVAAENLIYNGTEQVGVAAAEGYTLSGVTAATDAGEYIAIATLADGYKWADGSLEDKTITWSIAKAANEWITEPKISLESWIEGETAGELTDGIAKFGAVTVTINGAAFTAFPTAIGSYSIEYTVAETSNYSGLNKLIMFEILQKPVVLPTINPDWGYIAMNLGEKKNEVAIVFTNHIEKAMTWTVPDDIENVQFLVVGGGGGGGSAGTGGGGGAGGGGVVTGMIHKLEMDSTISVVVGAGGAEGTRNSAGGLLASAQGGNSTLTIGSVGAITAYGGAKVHKDGEYSGGSGNGSYGAGKAGTATKGKVDLSVEELVYSVESFGNNGGHGYNNKVGGGGGGAYPGDEGRGGSATSSVAGKGGAGLVSNITGEPITYGSGGGGSTSTVGAEGGEGAGNGCSNKSAKVNQGGGGGGAGKYSSGGKGGSGIVVIRYTIPGYLLPEVFPEVTDDSKVAAALEGSADVNLVENIKTAAEYAAFREWALNLEGITPEEVKASPNAWLSYALNTDKLIIAAPKEGDVVIDTFESSANDGVFEFTVKIDGIKVGKEALEANLKKVFGIEGAETLANGGAGFSTDNVEVNTATPESGNVKFSVTPKLGNGEKPDSFFFRVKMK